MKITHYINNLGSGGAEKLLTDILPDMKSKGHLISVIYCNKDKNVAKFEKTLTDNEIKIINLNNSFYNPLQIVKIIRIVNNSKPDIIHAHLFPTQYWLSIASWFFPKKTKLIKTEHSVHNERKQYKLLQPIEKLIYSRYNKIIGITSQVTENLQNWLNSRDKIVTIENGVNLEQVRQGRNEELNLNLEKDNFNILMVGRFDGWQKDQESLIKALDYLPSNVVLYFAGEGDYLVKVKNLVNITKKNNQVNFLGLRQDVYTLMANMDLNVLSTNHEGLSGVALESLASGKPFLGSDVVGVNNIVPDNNFLFPPKNPKALASKIERLINDNSFRNMLIDEAAQHITKYDIKNMTKRYLELYKSTL